jgi:hypothetical protein
MLNVFTGERPRVPKFGSSCPNIVSCSDLDLNVGENCEIERKTRRKQAKMTKEKSFRVTLWGTQVSDSQISHCTWAPAQRGTTSVGLLRKESGYYYYLSRKHSYFRDIR